MKRIMCIFCMLGIALFVSGSSVIKYTKAIDLMEADDYLAAAEILETIPEYRDAADLIEECEKAEVYFQGVDLYNSGIFEEAVSIFSGLTDYRDSGIYKSNAIEQIQKKTKEEIATHIDQLDAVALCRLISESYGSSYATDEIVSDLNSYIVATFEEKSKDAPYEFFQFFDDLLIEGEQYEQFANTLLQPLTQLNEQLYERRIKAFLIGDWIRVDDTISNGLQIRVVDEGEYLSGYVIDSLGFQAQGASFHWDRGMNIWKEIRIIEHDLLSAQTMGLTYHYGSAKQTVHYDPSSAFIDLDGMRLIFAWYSISTTPQLEQQNTQIYVRQSAIKEKPDLTEADYVVNIDGENHAVTDLLDWKRIYWLNSRSLGKTARGIQIGSSYADVIDAYGYSSGNLYFEKEDPIYAKVRSMYQRDENTGELLHALFTMEVDEFLEYTCEESNIVMRVYFKEKSVSWICWYII